MPFDWLWPSTKYDRWKSRTLKLSDTSRIKIHCFKLGYGLVVHLDYRSGFIISKPWQIIQTCWNLFFLLWNEIGNTHEFPDAMILNQSFPSDWYLLIGK